MNERLSKTEYFLAAAAILSAVLCVALLLFDTVFPREHPGYLKEVSSSEAAGIYLINVNTDDAEHLQELPGIGETLARRIVEYREENGNFTCAEDLLNVEGIGEKKLMEFQDLITF